MPVRWSWRAWWRGWVGGARLSEPGPATDGPVPCLSVAGRVDRWVRTRAPRGPRGRPPRSYGPGLTRRGCGVCAHGGERARPAPDRRYRGIRKGPARGGGPRATRRRAGALPLSGAVCPLAGAGGGGADQLDTSTALCGVGPCGGPGRGRVLPVSGRHARERSADQGAYPLPARRFATAVAVSDSPPERGVHVRGRPWPPPRGRPERPRHGGLHGGVDQVRRKAAMGWSAGR